MSKGEFYMRVGKPKRPVPYDTSLDLAERIIANQIATGKVIEQLYLTIRDIEGVNQDKTRDMMETRLTRINRNGQHFLLKLIELHNARSDMCTNYLKERK